MALRFRLAQTRSGAALSAHMAVVERVTHGTVVPALLQQWNSSPVPDRYLHLIPLYDEINGRRARRSEFNGAPVPLGWEHIAAWQAVTGEQLSRQEIEILFRMDDTLAKAAKDSE